MITPATAPPAGSPRWRWPAARSTGAATADIGTSSSFLESLARRYPKLELHLICDNYGTHKHPAGTHWLAAHPRFHLHFTPTSAGSTRGEPQAKLHDIELHKCSPETPRTEFLQTSLVSGDAVGTNVA
jgi:hypothetical protein